MKACLFVFVYVFVCGCVRFPFFKKKKMFGAVTTPRFILGRHKQTGEVGARWAAEERELEAAEGQGEGGRGEEAGGVTGATGAGVQHPEESVLVGFVSVKSQKNMLNIWGLAQRGEGRRGSAGGCGRQRGPED